MRLQTELQAWFGLISFKYLWDSLSGLQSKDKFLGDENHEQKLIHVFEMSA